VQGFPQHVWYRVRIIDPHSVDDVGSPHPNRSDETTMTLSVTPVRRPSSTPTPTLRRTRLTDIDPHAASVVRTAGRVTDVPDPHSDRPITFNSAS
jgi:hypothetical protein